jgi:hypothetical protein
LVSMNPNLNRLTFDSTSCRGLSPTASIFFTGNADGPRSLTDRGGWEREGGAAFSWAEWINDISPSPNGSGVRSAQDVSGYDIPCERERRSPSVPGHAERRAWRAFDGDSRGLLVEIQSRGRFMSALFRPAPNSRSRRTADSARAGRPTGGRSSTGRPARSVA